MKRASMFLFAFIIFISLNTFTASAVDFAERGLTFSVPPDLINDEKWADENGYSFALADEEYNIELNIAIEKNTNANFYTGFTDEVLDIYAQDMVPSDLEDAEYTAQQVTINGFEGVRAAMSGKFEGYPSKYINYAFSTYAYVYWFDFYIYNDSYIDYVDDIMDTVKIEGKAYRYGDKLAIESAEVTKEPKKIEAENGLLIFEIPTGFYKGSLADDALDELWISSSPEVRIGYKISDNIDRTSFCDRSDLELLTYEKSFDLRSEGAFSNSQAENCEAFGIKGVKITSYIEDDDCDATIYMFATKEKEICIYCYAYEEGANEIIERILETMKINGEAYVDFDYMKILVVVIALIGTIIISVIKKRKKKDEKSEFYFSDVQNE